ncbi:MAG: acyl-CoA dehydratase activase [Lachnospiraceae bacterium]|nr:acyl-CoA dehydratase activase [Lachnospiraceae bacterium]
MNKTYYICKYTPIELLAAFGGECENLNHMPEGFERAEQIAHPNLCGFGKAVLEQVLAGGIKELVLVNCCDTIRSVYDILEDTGQMDFLYMIDMLHFDEGSCSRERVAAQLKELATAYSAYRGTAFDKDAFFRAFAPKERMSEPHLAVLGARMGEELFRMTERAMPLPVVNESCVNNRSVGAGELPRELDFEELMDWYAGELLTQLPCMRMLDSTGRKQLYQDPSLRGIIYHTVKFCDFYSFEYADIKNHTDVPLLKIESDYTLQSSGQLSTRLEAFAESLTPEIGEKKENNMGKGYFAGIDSGSTSTDVVILDRNLDIVAEVIMPTGAGAALGAERALEEALKEVSLSREDIDSVVTTGYGRSAIEVGDRSITEITCHARGAHFLDPEVRTVIDIGGQDSKVIRLGEDGSVKNFVMNDKCAAGTGHFLEMMARTMEMSLDELSEVGLTYKEDITISSMCTVFAESEIVSLVAQNKSTDDIVHGLNKAVAAKTASLVKRVGGEEKYMMTGGVARNRGLVKTLEERLGTRLVISEKSQLCGALGAALFAADMVTQGT